MSRRTLLTGSAAPAFEIPDPLPGGGGGDPDPGTGWPDTDDTTLLALRPAGRVVASGTVANTAARNTESARLVAAIDADGLGGGYGYWDYAGPDYRTELFLQPGTYTGGGNSAWRSVVGTDPDNRTVLASDVANGGVIHSFGSHYMENLHLTAITNSENSAPKYPWHITGGEMCIAANCTFDLSQIEPGTIEGGSGIAGWVGADGDSGMTILLYKCHFEPGPLANTLNIHGPGGELRLPMTTIFVDCTGLDSLELYAPGDVATEGGGSRLYVINTPVAKVGAAAGCHVYTDGAAPAMSSNAGTIHRGVTEWPIPEGGMSDLWSEHFYPSSVGSGYTYTPTVTDAAPFQPVVGRTYYTRIRPDRAARYTHFGVTCTTAAGQYAIRSNPADSPYVRDEAPPIESLDPDVTLALGANQWKAYYAYTRYPGDNGFWHRVEFSSSSARVTGSATLAGITDCAYTDNGTTLVPVAAGTPHPLPFVRAT